MTPIDLVDTLVQFIKKSVRDYEMPFKDGVVKLPSVHAGYLPPKNKTANGKEDISDFPYVLVRYLGEEDDESNQIALRIIIGTYSEDEQNGWRDPLNIATRIKMDLRKVRDIGPFSLTGKISTDLPEEQIYPYWFGIMDLSFNSPQVQKEWSDFFE